MTTPPFNPQPCGAGGAGGDSVDVEQTILCDTLPDGTVAGTAMAVWEYDAAGAPTGPPTFVDPATGNPYVAQGTLMPCPGETGCLEPVAFHRTTTSTGSVDHPGRQYDITLPINPGFAVQSLQVDQVTNAANIVWDVSDPDGERFRQDLAAFIDARVPAAATVTITNPNAGQVICGTAAPMQVHIECLRLDQSPPDLIELVYNGGQDLVINPAYNETPPLNPPVSQGNYGFHLLGRQDNNTYPSNPPANRANCTDVANRGWETNDVGRTFEIWGRDIVTGENVTPTPRGTPVQEMTSDGAPPGGRSTIWQTFTAPASGNFIIRVVHGARDPGEEHRITLDNGDTDDAQHGDLIDNVTTPPSVTNAGGPNPWTQFSQTIPLTGGSTYTLALSSTNPVVYNRGGLFTDMRAYIDRPDLRATATTDDDTCVVPVEETTTACQDELWSPICERGTIQSWQNAETGQILANAAFWGQAPAPIPGPCPAPAGSGAGGSVAANLVHTYPVCATIGGVRTNLQRVVITDGSGGVLADSFIGPDGGPVATPSSYDIGSCTDTAFMGDQVLCDDNGPFLRKYVQDVNDVGQPQVKAHGDFTLAGAAYTPVGEVSSCEGELTLGEVCYTDPGGGPSRRGFLVRDAAGGAHVYGPSGTEVTPFPVIVVCPEASYYEEVLCDQGADGHQFIRRYIGSPIQDASEALWDFELDGATQYNPVGPVALCQEADPCCQPTQVCVTPKVIQETQFVSNPDKVYNDTVDGTWQWAPVGAFTDPTQVTTWYQTYKARFAPNPAAWSVTDAPTRASGTANAPTAGWIAPHPGGLTGSTGAPGEGPSLNAENWWARASFDLPASADPASIKVEITVLNADQKSVRYRLNSGAWQAMPASATYNGTRFTLAPSALPGVQAGTNTLYFEVQETLPNTPSNGAGVMAHFIVTYATPGHASWTRMVCCDDTVYYIDDQGVRHDTLPEGYSIEPCGTAAEPLLLCDDNGPFLRHVSYADGAVTVRDTTLIGEDYSAAGAVHSCSSASTGTGRDEEVLVLCDATPTRFLRRYSYDSSTGALLGVVNTTLDGTTLFAPVGAVGICTTPVATDFDFTEEVLCDSNGTAFIRRFTFNSSTGAVTATTNLTLAGAAFNPVGTVGVCSNCCPQVVGNGCTNTGSGFYTAIRAANGTISLIDSVTGAAVTAANIIPCPSDNTVRTLTAQARQLTNATPWTPAADVAGTLTSLTVTGVSGLWDLVDANGTALTGLPAGLTLTWQAEDDNTLTGPQSVTPQAGASVVAVWTQR